MAKILALAAALVAIAQIAAAAPGSPVPTKAVLKAGSRKRVNPKVAHKTFTASSAQGSVSSFAAPGKPEDAATKFVAAQLNIPASDFRISDIVPLSNGGSAVHLRQVINGLDVANANINVNVDSHGRVISYGDAFFRGARPAAPPTTVAPGQVHTTAATKVSPQSGFEKLAAAVGLSLDGKKIDVQPAVSVQSVGKPTQKKWTIKTDAALSDVPVKYAYIQNGDSLKLVYNYAVELDNAWYNAHVDATTGEVQHIADWVSDATYSAIPVGQLNPNDGGFKTVNAQIGGVIDKTASPLGWHAQSTTKSFTDTRGNNAYAQENLSGSTGNQWQTNKRPDGGAALDFTKFKPDLTKAPSAYTAGSTAQLFVIANQVHDITYHYGFDEASGNFQENNFGKGGRQTDAVIANAQDGASTNNADFATPPDGQRGKMRMYTFTETTPGRDGTLDTGVPIHEYGHGVSNRLTGGPSNSDCLNDGESGGMGEGWSDMLALVLNAKKTDTRTTAAPMGTYVIGNAAGIRTYPYSSDTSVNPTMYSYLAKSDYNEVHMAGEVWVANLWEVYWNLRDKLGASADLRTGVSSGKGDATFLQIMLDGMKLQPCNPTFIDARDAIVQAEQNLTGGKYKCDVWAGFAARGLGVNAGNADAGYTDSSDVPSDCQ